MKFSVNWLREFVELPSSVGELAKLLTLAGIEIVGIEKRGANFDKVVVARITASSQHPNADRLSVCQVDGGGGQTRQIVCGAKNYKVGDKVPLALPGAVLANDLKIKSSKLRGVESEGMLCSGKELALSEESDGLLILSPDAKIGRPIGSLFPDDTILDVEITPNRGDLLSHFGLAREISALVGQPASGGLPNHATADGAPALQMKGVEISAPRECPFYSARRIGNVMVGPSPDWLRAKLEAVGLRSINNIVDISNFVMLDLGQPTHAFDSDKLTGGINVRLANENEKFLALDGKTYSLGADNLVIADDARAVGIAGVMGGEDTRVTETTKNVLLESAYFRPGSVRRTARKLNLPSDSSYRFERGVDPGMILRASQRATELIRELAAGNPSPEIATAGELPAQPKDVSLRYERCTRLIGAAVPKDRVDQILEGFGLKKARTSEDETSWRIPSYRSDLQREADLIEEIVRVFGIDRVSAKDQGRFTPLSKADRIYDRDRGVRQRAIAHRLVEVRTTQLIPTLYVDIYKETSGTMLKVRNPLDEFHVCLRGGLLPGLVRVAELALRKGEDSIRIFELGTVFTPQGSQKKCLGILLTGETHRQKRWRDQTFRMLDFFDLKGVIGALDIRRLSFGRIEDNNFAMAASVLVDGENVGICGQLSNDWQTKSANSKTPIFVAEIDTDTIPPSEQVSFVELERFPSITRDIAMIVPEKLTHAEIVAMIEGAREPLLATIELFDLFYGKEAAGFGAGRKSLAYTLTYRDKTRTLTNDEITVVHAKIRERLQRELGVELRE
jgi:phenylalanyl-tRNA synthetase beta chain